MSRRLSINKVTWIDMSKLDDYYIIDGSIEHMELRKVSTISLPKNTDVSKWAEGKVFYEIKEELI